MKMLDICIYFIIIVYYLFLSFGGDGGGARLFSPITPFFLDGPDGPTPPRHLPKDKKYNFN